MHVSLAMTIRATEPIFTLFLSPIFLSNYKFPTNHYALISLIPIVVGAGLSSLSSTDFTVIGLCMICISNLSFATRAIYYKDTKRESGLNSFEMFYYISRNASLMYASLCFLSYSFSSSASSKEMKDSILLVITNRSYLFMLLANGICFFAYLQLSVVVLSKVSAITHGVMNSMRRPVTIAVSAMWFNRSLSNPNKIGIFMACVGSMMYTLSKTKKSKILDGDNDGCEGSLKKKKRK